MRTARPAQRHGLAHATGRGISQRIAATVVASVLSLGWLGAADASAASAHRLPGVHVIGWGFSEPDVVASVGGDLFVADGGYNSITEIDAAAGALVRVIAGPKYRINDPSAMAAVGGDLFVADCGSYSVTEIDAATGALVRVISAPSYQLYKPVAIAAAGGDMFVADFLSDSVT
jgi:hypothetical protein